MSRLTHPFLPHYLSLPLLVSFLDFWALLSRPTVCMHTSEDRICIAGRRGCSDFSSLCCSTFVVDSIHTAQSVLMFRHHQLNSENRTPGSLRNVLHVLFHKVKCFGIMGSTKDVKNLSSSQGPWRPHAPCSQGTGSCYLHRGGAEECTQALSSVHSPAQRCSCWMRPKGSNSPFIPVLSTTNMATISGTALKANWEV